MGDPPRKLYELTMEPQPNMSFPRVVGALRDLSLGTT